MCPMHSLLAQDKTYVSMAPNITGCLSLNTRTLENQLEIFILYGKESGMPHYLILKIEGFQIWIKNAVSR
jgi:hypothetical protein